MWSVFLLLQSYASDDLFRQKKIIQVKWCRLVKCQHICIILNFLMKMNNLLDFLMRNLTFVFLFWNFANVVEYGLFAHPFDLMGWKWTLKLLVTQFFINHVEKPSYWSWICLKWKKSYDPSIPHSRMATCNMAAVLSCAIIKRF